MPGGSDQPLQGGVRPVRVADSSDDGAGQDERPGLPPG